MKHIVEIKLVVDEELAELGRAELFVCANDTGYAVLSSCTRPMTPQEEADARVQNLID